MLGFKTFSPADPLSVNQKNWLADFLVMELGEFGDPKQDVLKCLDYAMRSKTGPGGLVILAGEFPELEAALVLNHTGMSGYIPEHILVYFAVSEKLRGKGLGKNMLEFLLTKIDGGIALHVEPSNPAIRLYEKLGFSNKYLEMRLLR
ncbi:N-acetyltransferase [Algoriphagus sp. A40]|uniref:GNAT family N-acetyltransferase n=1 Tax=Algoriphagus sp. A40 TaxID=1945863 RepID=UPI000985DE21|nr:GNAT family N-acetyltransferase [Algoriphagus sp. A40]OOG75271.1 GNAT family N-acetyltransferase [Algoriphagus sp. A40]